MSFSKIRTLLYKAAKYLGDVQAVQKSVKTGNFTPIVKRIIRRIYGKITSRGMPK